MVTEPPQHPLLVTFEILTVPPFVVPHQFSCIGKFISIKPGGKASVGITGHFLAGPGPRIHDFNRLFRIALISGNPPNQCTLVSRSRIIHGGSIIVTFRFPDIPSSTDNLDCGIGFPIQIHMLAGHQLVVGRRPRFLPCGQLFLHPVEIRLRVQYAGMYESLRHPRQRHTDKQQRQYALFVHSIHFFNTTIQNYMIHSIQYGTKNNK